MKKFRIIERPNEHHVRFIPQYGYKYLPFVWFNFNFLGTDITFIDRHDAENYIEMEKIPCLDKIKSLPLYQ